jgi:hypothetical protein
LDGLPAVLAVLTPVTVKANLPSLTSWPIPAIGGGTELVAVYAGAVVFPEDEAEVLLVPLLPPEKWPIMKSRSTTPKTIHGHFLRFLAAGAGAAAKPPGGGGGALDLCSVHRVPSQYRSPLPPPGSGCQPGGVGGGGGVVISPPLQF